jgi:hypothetical protein
MADMADMADMAGFAVLGHVRCRLACRARTSVQRG